MMTNRHALVLISGVATEMASTDTILGNISGLAGTATALANGRTISITGDLAYTSASFDGSGNVTAGGILATVNSNVGTFGSATKASVVTVNGKGLVTSASESTVTPAIGSITGFGTGIATALTINVGTAGSAIVNGGALGTPSSGTATNLTGTATGLTAGNATVAVTVSQATQSSITQVGTLVTGQLVNSGTGTATGGLQSTINVNTTPVSNVTTGETDLMSYTLPANSLSAIGKIVRVTCWGNQANNSNVKTVQTYVGGTSINSATLLVSSLGIWKVDLLFICTGSSTQSYFSETKRLNATASNISALVAGTLAKTDTANIIIKLTGTGGATTDITQQGMIVEFLN